MSTGTDWDWHYDRVLPEETSNGIYIWNVGDHIRRLQDNLEGVVVGRTALEATVSVGGRWVMIQPPYYADAEPKRIITIDQFDKGWQKQ